VLVRGFRPNGGPEWWPGVTFDTYPYGNDGCYLVDNSRLVPTRRLDGLRGDIKDLRSWLSPKALASGSKTRESIKWPDYQSEKEAHAKLSPTKIEQSKKKWKAYCATPTP
jgi:hypothetical protein